MIIVTHENIKVNNTTVMPIQEFLDKAMSEEGISDDNIKVDVNTIKNGVIMDGGNKLSEEEIYNTLKEANCKFISFYKSYPSFVDPGSVNIVDIPGISDKEEKTSEIEKIANQAQNSIDYSRYSNPGTQSSLSSLISDTVKEQSDDLNSAPVQKEKKLARTIAIGSSKGGVGKSFTAIDATHYYGIEHSNERIAFVDWDVKDGQDGATINVTRPTLKQFFKEYRMGNKDFNTMHKYCVKAAPPFAQNVDFYLPPRDIALLARKDDKMVYKNFWDTVLINVIENYDLVVFDTGIDYLECEPITNVYKMVDKLVLITCANKRSVYSVINQILNITGRIPTTNHIFSEKDEIAKKLNIAVTRVLSDEQINNALLGELMKYGPIIAKFGVYDDEINQAEIYGLWNIFDNNTEFRQQLRNIMA